MNRHIKLTGILAIFTLSSCATQPMSNENAKGAGAGAGALGGAILGGIIGHQSGNALEGAAIGAAGGGIAGYQNGADWFGGDKSIQKTRRGN